MYPVRLRGMVFPLALLVLVSVTGCPPRQEPEVTVTITPSSATLPVTQTVVLQAESTDPDDDFTWTTDSPGVATVDESGVVTGHSVGEAAITATGTASGAEDTAVITVTAAVSEAVMEEMAEAKAYIEDIPGDVASQSTKERLFELLAKAEAEYTGGRPCSAADVLDEYLAETQQLRSEIVAKAAQKAADTEDVGYAEWLYAQGRGAQYDLLVLLPEDLRCSGYDRVGMPPELETGVSDVTRLTFRVSFGAPRTMPVYSPEGTVHTGLLLPAVQKMNDAGMPGVPSERRLFAAPWDAEIVADAEAKPAEALSVDLLPFQEQPFDQSKTDPTISDTEPDPSVYADFPFAKNEKVYATDAPWPPTPVQITRLGRFRELELVQVDVFGGQYNPVSDELVLFDNVRVGLSFKSGNKGFVTDAAFSPFESDNSVYIGSVVNQSAVINAAKLPIQINPKLLGEELLIITHPDFRDAADALAAWKNQKGIVTNVFEGGTGSGVTGRETAHEIDDFVESRYDTCLIKPTYLLLLGDAEFIPPFLAARMNTAFGDTIGTDWYYAERSYPGQEFPTLVPTFAVGRIPVDTLQQAHDVVDKIIAYEKTPPGGVLADAFYNRVTLAAQFQCCRTSTPQAGVAQRTFSEVSEFVRAPLVAKGYNVERIYRRTVDAAYAGDPTPRRYYDGTLLPAAIGPGSGFAWNGSTTDVIDAFNEGRFLVMHRDHGWSGGWGTPQFTSTHVSTQLSNGPWQPVVFSINCTSGYFDNETAPGGSSGSVYFTERLLRLADGGAVGVIGDTRVSPSWPNSALARGLFDAVWPDVLPGFGGATSKRRLGDILNHAKLYLLTQVGVSGAGTSYSDAYDMLLLYHVFGDPTMEMWTSDPKKLTLPGSFVLEEVHELGFRVLYEAEGAEITAYQQVKGEVVPIGRAMVVNGEANIDFFSDPIPDFPVLLAANLDNAVAAAGSVQLEKQ